ncbi:phosphate-starvation-inducible PsiE family protein [Laspinema olomoucense]|uniref:Phosphate-starvation-inducible PsiE family protein n=1 Tax=Laspinema olomoucense D3b TaxID=2953688 RepID=A0ABT2NA19_9CYAN|nr:MULTISPECIES: phosphate-starvation-inducible PsiE family protein [unclassified Laspinema]MCT7979527.1 phosphate-starvation-inducible PsiE family protein [Laspinema sp. D3b]MCT7987683.1 phosphate-starvation-inducible PsiE family protein [Laspinema sp. D3a]MCT7997530.1 phosphate-starvation-inducible PsiE family protein [Laspinema sp. D3c]
MSRWTRGYHRISHYWRDNNFVHLTEQIQIVIAKILSILMIIIILVALWDLMIYLAQILFTEPVGFLTNTLFKIFGLFLNILISMEILENITAYMKKHTVQVELVIVTSLVAVARKIIIFDLEKYSDFALLGLAVAIFALSISYWIVRTLNSDPRG